MINSLKDLLKLRYFLKDPVAQLSYFLKKNLNAPEDMHAEVSDYPELNKDQYAVSTSDPKGYEDLNAYSIFFLKYPKIVK